MAAEDGGKGGVGKTSLAALLKLFNGSHVECDLLGLSCGEADLAVVPNLLLGVQNGLRLTLPTLKVDAVTSLSGNGWVDELDGTGVSVTVVYPGEVESDLHAHEKESMPAWYDLDNRAPAGPLGERVARAVERDARAVHYPPIVRMLRVIHNLSPRLGDLLLRTLRGRSAAPRRG